MTYTVVPLHLVTTRRSLQLTAASTPSTVAAGTSTE